MNEIDRQVHEIGALFEGRLPAAALDDALDYLHANEFGLALYVLCEQLIEYDVKITASEYDRVRSMADLMYPDSSSLPRLAEQIVS